MAIIAVLLLVCGIYFLVRGLRQSRSALGAYRKAKMEMQYCQQKLDECRIADVLLQQEHAKRSKEVEELLKIKIPDPKKHQSDAPILQSSISISPSIHINDSKGS